MHAGILTCGGDLPVRDVADLMARFRVHAVAITRANMSAPVGVITDLDIAGAALNEREARAAQVAATEPLAISADESLRRAAQLMTEHGVSHLIVLDAADGHPAGVLSALDIAAVFAGVR